MANASKKNATPADEKLSNVDFDLFKAIEALDRKDYNYLNNLTEEQRKKFSPYMLLRWMSCVKGNPDVTAYYLMNVNAVANKHMFNEYVIRHPQLQWLMLCAASPGIGKQYHQWLPHLKEGIGKLEDRATVKEVGEYFAKIYPSTDGEVIREVAEEFVTLQNHRHRLAGLYPEMKISDIEALANFVTSEDIDQYERDAGIR
jgi:hypothetical protein